MTWRDVRGPGWTRRARIYRAPLGTDWKVVLTDPTHEVRLYVPDCEQAKEIMRRFEAGESAKELSRVYG